jgi:hypothetical protein
MEIAGYKLKEIESYVGVVPSLQMTFGQARELTEADREFVERHLLRHARRYPGPLAAIQRMIVRSVLEASDIRGFSVEKVAIDIFPLPKVKFVFTPADAPLSLDAARIMRAIDGVNRTLQQSPPGRRASPVTAPRPHGQGQADEIPPVGRRSGRVPRRPRHPGHRRPPADGRGDPARGHVLCGVSPNAAGFIRNPRRVGGFEVDYCRAIASVIRATDKVGCAPPRTARRRWKGQVDLLTRSTTWTLERDAGGNVAFPVITYYDGQGFMLRSDQGVRRIQQMDKQGLRRDRDHDGTEHHRLCGPCACAFTIVPIPTRHCSPPSWRVSATADQARAMAGFRKGAAQPRRPVHPAGRNHLKEPLQHGRAAATGASSTSSGGRISRCWPPRN